MTTPDNRPFLMIGTPAYNGLVHVDYVNSLLEFAASGFRFMLVTSDGESLITRARNGMLSRFHSSPEFTHLLFVDGDVRLTARSLQKLLSHDKDVIGAPVPLKTTPQQGKVFNVDGVGSPQGTLVKVNRVGTAVLMLSRKAVDALVEDARAQGHVYHGNPLVRGAGDVPEQYDVFRVGVAEGEYLSEDFWVCRRLSQLGFDTWVDLSIRTRHFGMFDFSAIE